MLRFIRQGQRWFVTALVALIGGVFILFFGPWDFSQTAGNAAVPVSVDGTQFTQDDLGRVRDNLERRYREQLGDQFDAVSAQLQIQDRAIRELIDRAILAREAERMGLAAGDGEVEQTIRELFSSYRDGEGRLDEEQARANVIYEWGSVRRFKEAIRTDIVLRKLGRVLLGTAGASRAEARESLRYQEEEVRIAFVALDPAAPPENLEALTGDVEEFARVEAQRVSDYYDENLSRYQEPEQVRLRHVLVRVGDEGEEAAREKAEAARARIAGGEDMASVAGELSEDEGSKKLGGDLGLLPTGLMAGALRDAAAGLGVRELSEVVRGEQGFHVLRVEERRDATTRALEEMSLEIAEELYRKDQAGIWVTKSSDELQAAIAGGKSLEEAARELRLNIERTAFFRRRPDGYIPDVGDSLDVQTAAFAATEEEPSWPYPLPIGNMTAFIQLLERRSPDAGELDARTDGEQERLDQEARQRAEQLWLAERRTQLQSEGRIFIDPNAVTASP